jgi:hypothetical protein
MIHFIELHKKNIELKCIVMFDFSLQMWIWSNVKVDEKVDLNEQKCDTVYVKAYFV